MEIKLNLSNTEHKELIAYCNLNDFLVSDIVKKSYTTGFNIERYGLLNLDDKNVREVVKEVVVEKRVEIPVEVIKEVVKIEYVEIEKPVEVIREIQVDKIVEVQKEVFVDKQIDESLKSKLEALQLTVQKLKQDNIEKDKKISEYENIVQEIQKSQGDRKAMFLKGSNLEDNLYR